MNFKKFNISISKVNVSFEFKTNKCVLIVIPHEEATSRLKFLFLNLRHPFCFKIESSPLLFLQRSRR